MLPSEAKYLTPIDFDVIMNYFFTSSSHESNEPPVKKGRIGRTWSAESKKVHFWMKRFKNVSLYQVRFGCWLDKVVFEYFVIGDDVSIAFLVFFSILYYCNLLLVVGCCTQLRAPKVKIFGVESHGSNILPYFVLVSISKLV